jgi:pimeloyl-ACP methyl ester carboxylesterase
VKSNRRLIKYIVASIISLSVCFVVVVAIVANIIYSEVFRPTSTPRPEDAVIVAMEEGQVILRSTGRSKHNEWKLKGTWGIIGEEAYAQIGKIIRINKEQVVRKFEVLEGVFHAGANVWVDALIYPDDPQRAFGLPLREVNYTSDLGRFPAYFIEGGLDTWVIFVHGKRDIPHDSPPFAYPIMPVITQMGFPILDISYRNDIGVPESFDRLHWYGLTEWQDLEGAAQYALSHGAQSLVLYGFSMGGGIIASFLHRSDLAKKVVGVVLDGPMLNLNTVIEAGFRQRGLPTILIQPSKRVVSLWTGMKWTDLNHLVGIEQWQTPILLFHGTDDQLVPVETSALLTQKRPDLVNYVPIPGATHGASWNLSPKVYERSVRHFLGELSN